MNKPAENQRAHGRLAVGIFFLVLGVYLVTYVGAFKSNDERAYFSGMDSFVKRGEFTANQIYWDYTAVGMLTKQGDMVPNYEPGQMIAPIPLYLWGRALGAAVQGAMFFNALVLAASAAMLFLCFAELGYSRGAGLLGSLVFAFATLAWPYSRTFFREPLTTLAYLLAFYALLRYRPPAPRRLLWPALAGFALGLAIVTKLIGVGVIPGLALLAWATEWRRPPEPGRPLWRTRLRMALAAAIPLAVVLLLYQVYNWMTLSGVETFGRNIVEYTTNPQLSQTVPMRMLRAFTGITISPYKGLFWYCPVLLLGIGGAYFFIRRHKWEGWAALLIVVAHIAGYSRYNYWSGGVAWGMRYLLPIIPFLVLLAAPVWELLTTKTPRPHDEPDSSRVFRRSLWLRVLVVASWLLIALSVFIQVLGVSIDLLAWEVKWLLDNIPIWGGLGQAIEGLMLRPDQSPVLGHLRLLLSGQPLDFAWVQRRPQGATAVLPQGLILSLLLALAGIAACVAIWRRPQAARWIAPVMTLVVILGASALLLVYRQGDARFDTYNGDRFLKPMLADLENAGRCQRQGLQTKCQDVFVVPDPALTDYFLNYLKAPLPWYSLEPRPV
ncbi:MAG: ArnT family glycosyltransferase, partial [Nitrososphaerales archaeon]